MTGRLLRSAVAFVALASFAGNATGPGSAQADPGVVHGSYIVVYRDDIVAAADISEVIDNEPGIEITHVYEHALDGFAAELTDAALSELRSDPRVAEIVPDRKMYAFAQTLPKGANRVDADLNPYAAIDGVDQRVDADIAVLDMGVGPNGDLNVAGGTDCSIRNSTLDNGGHGTHVAGIAAAKDNATGIVGVAPGARIWSIKVLDAYEGNWSWVICGIDWVTAHADVIEVANLSLGERISPSNQAYDGPMRRAIQGSVAAGVTYVAAAGNSGSDAAYTIPASYPEVIAVSAIADSDGKPGGLGPTTSAGRDDHRATFSNYGNAVDIAAPGVSTVSTAPGGGLSTMSGTSFATPHVVGAAALYIAQHGRVGPAAVKAALQAAADPGPIPGDPDGYPEKVLNVGRFAGGKIVLSKSNGVPGDPLTITLTSFPRNAKVELAWDGRTAGSVATDGSGATSVQTTVPSITKGPHLLSAKSGNAVAGATFTIMTAVRLSPASGTVGQQLKIVLRGYASRESIQVTWKNGALTSTLATTNASSSGNATVYVAIPAALRGAHLVSGKGSAGSSASATYTVVPRLTFSPSSGPPGSTVRLSMRGFGSSEQVNLTIDSGSGPQSLGTTVVSRATGSRNFDVQIPVDAPAGAATLRAVGNAGTSISAAFTITAPAAPQQPPPTPSSTATATSGPSPTATTEIAATPTPTETLSPTVASTVEPTVTLTPADVATPDG